MCWIEELNEEELIEEMEQWDRRETLLVHCPNCCKTYDFYEETSCPYCKKF